MAFQTTLPSGDKLRLENRNGQTQLSFRSGSENQRQSQSQSFPSGTWTHPPTLFQAPDGLILRVEGERNHYLSIENGAAHALPNAPDLNAAQVVPLPFIAEAAHQMAPLPPLEPLQGMAPLKPMEMKMGSMQMNMGGAPSHPPSAPRETSAPPLAPPTAPQSASSQSASSQSASSRAAFCTQCGQRAQEGDRFCARCGHELRVL